MIFQLRLCLNLGKTLGELQKMPAPEYTLWIAYAALYGLPTDRVEAQHAVGYNAVVRSLGGKTKPEDFVPERQTATTPKQQWEMIQAWAIAHNANVRSNGRK